MSNDRELTFIVWGDTHFGFDQKFGDEDLRYRTVKQMGMLEGYPYPEDIGGLVGKPELILHCGDVMDGGPRELAIYHHCMRQVDIPYYETLGNHDLGEATEEYFLERYKQRWYSFDCGGVHFLALYRPKGMLANDVMDDVSPVSDEQLNWLADDLGKQDPKTPVVAFCHAKPENCPNAGELDTALSKGNVVLIFIGHLHQQPQFTPHRYDWNGRYCYLIGHCRDHHIDPIFARTFLVVRIRGTKYDLVLWRWDLQDWAGY